MRDGVYACFDISWSRKINEIAISSDENFLTIAVRHTVRKTTSPSSSLPAVAVVVIGVKLKRTRKNPTAINTYLRENKILAARKGQGRRRRRTAQM